MIPRATVANRSLETRDEDRVTACRKRVVTTAAIQRSPSEPGRQFRRNRLPELAQFPADSPAVRQLVR